MSFRNYTLNPSLEIPYEQKARSTSDCHSHVSGPDRVDLLARERSKTGLFSTASGAQLDFAAEGVILDQE